MRRRSLVLGLCGLVGLVGMLGTVSGSSAAASSVWGNAIEVPGTATLNSAFASVSSLSCATAGNCSAGGSYTDGSGHTQAFVAGETNGIWSNAIEVPATPTLNSSGYASVLSVSCATAGNCAAGGFYRDGSFNSQAFVVEETNGSWGNAIEVPGTAALNVDGSASVLSVSCPTVGNCTAGGNYTDGSGHTQAFVAAETDGSWGNAIEVPATATLNSGGYANVNSVSCATAGNCTAGGNYTDGSNHQQVFVVDETNGSWSNAIEVPATTTLNSGGSANVDSLSCATAGNCTAGGSYRDGSGHTQAFVVGETSGIWSNAIEVPATATLNSGGFADVKSVSCAAAGNCTAGGYYTDGSGHNQAFVVGETTGSWGNAIEVPGTAALNTGGSAFVKSVSCATAGNCAAGGDYFDGSGFAQAFVVNETNGSWGSAIEVPGTATLNSGGGAVVNSVSCAPAGYCAGGGFYTDGSGRYQAFVVGSAASYSVAYNGNGASGGSAPSDAASPYTAGTTVTVLGAGTLTKTGYTFSGWNTAANGSGTPYKPGATFPMPAANVTLYARWAIKSTSETVHCNQKVPIASPGKNLSGVWKSNQLGTYYVRQIGSCVYATGLGTYNSPSQKYDYATTFFGAINSAGTTITGYWFDVNAGTRSRYGSLTLHVANGTHLTKTAQTGAFTASSWVQQSSSAAAFVSPSSSSAANSNLTWTCDPAATAAPTVNYLPSTIAKVGTTTVRYNVRQIGSCVVFWGRPKVSPVPTASPKWTYSNVFYGRSTGSGTSEVVKGPWADIPAGTNPIFGQLTLTVTGQHTFKASGTGGWTTTNFTHTP
jgi:uncharacterized repeat protein (TIGR02543 family)